jgi:Protein of unknown function (DUF3094)
VNEARKLDPEDQQRVDAFTSTGIHSVPRKPFRPLVLLAMILAVTTAMTVLSIVIERMYIP